MTGVIIGISLSWKYGKINNIKCLFLSQMFTISGMHVIHIHELKKVMAIKPPSLWAFQVVQISQLSTMTNWIYFCYTPLQQASRDFIAWQLIVVFYGPYKGHLLSADRRCLPFSTAAIPQVRRPCWSGPEVDISSSSTARRLCRNPHHTHPCLIWNK